MLTPAAVTRTLFLHAGPPKTGSTTIQTFFRDNAASFRRQGLFWPQTGTQSRSHLHRDLVNAFLPESNLADILEVFARELRAQDLPDRVFISAEMFAAQLDDPRYVAAIKNFCAGLGYRLHVIAYIRPQPALINSLYTQNVKNWRASGPIDEFVAQQLRGGRHDYARLFEPLLADGDIDMSFRPFNRATLRKGLIADICEVMGISPADGDIREPVIVNTSPGPKTVAAFLRISHRVKDSLPDLNRERLSGLTRPLLHAAGSLGWNDEKFGGLTQDLEAAVRVHFAATNDEFALRLWTRPWTSVFTLEDCQAPPFNVFDPAAADEQQRLEFHDFIEQSLETIAHFARIKPGRRRQMVPGPL